MSLIGNKFANIALHFLLTLTYKYYYYYYLHEFQVGLPNEQSYHLQVTASAVHTSTMYGTYTYLN